LAGAKQAGLLAFWNPSASRGQNKLIKPQNISLKRLMQALAAIKVTA
jgi:hypothetical protein